MFLKFKKRAKFFLSLYGRNSECSLFFDEIRDFACRAHWKNRKINFILCAGLHPDYPKKKELLLKTLDESFNEGLNKYLKFLICKNGNGYVIEKACFEGEKIKFKLFYDYGKLIYLRLKHYYDECLKYFYESGFLDPSLRSVKFSQFHSRVLMSKIDETFADYAAFMEQTNQSFYGAYHESMHYLLDQSFHEKLPAIEKLFHEKRYEKIDKSRFLSLGTTNFDEMIVFYAQHASSSNYMEYCSNNLMNYYILRYICYLIHDFLKFAIENHHVKLKKNLFKQRIIIGVDEVNEFDDPKLIRNYLVSIKDYLNCKNKNRTLHLIRNYLRFYVKKKIHEVRKNGKTEIVFNSRKLEEHENDAIFCQKRTMISSFVEVPIMDYSLIDKIEKCNLHAINAFKKIYSDNPVNLLKM